MDSKIIVATPMTEAVRRDISSLRTKLFYGLGSVAFGVKDQGFSYFLLFFYNQVIGAPSAWVSSAIAVALVFDAFADPIVGQISDNLRSKWGRRHPLMYGAAIPVAIGYYMLWNPPHWSHEALFYYLIGIIVVVRTFITMYEIPSSALIAELTPDYDNRTSFLGYRYLFGWLGGLAMTLLAFGYFFQATPQYPTGQLNPAGYVGYSITACILMVFAIIVSSAGTHKFIPYFTVPAKRKLSLWRVLTEMYETVKHRSFLVLIVSAIFSSVAAGTLTSLNNYFNTFFWGLSAGQIFWLNVIIIVAPFGALALATPYSSRIGKKAAAMSLWIASTLTYWLPMAFRLLGWFPENNSSSLVPLLITFTTIGTMLSIACQITISSMIADVVEDSALKTGRRSEGLFFSANAFILKAVSGMGILVAGLLLAFVQFPEHANPATLDPQIPKNLALAYFPVTFVLYAVALGCLSFYRIDRATHEDNVRRLAEEVVHAPVGVGLEGVTTPEHTDPADDIPR
ncbi:MAG TPA: MFS transporter [Rhizomicrobium sp.]|jgi:Na+/melibiose symporter-like transporter|nr:MFS transporter [Rhizomicrobium sp.]